jgi:hypothetical protein
MNGRSLGALVALNGLLLAALAVSSMYPATARGQVRWARGSYRMVAGNWTGGQGIRPVVYVVDNYSSKVWGFVYSSADIRNPLIPIVGRVINDDVAAQGR